MLDFNQRRAMACRYILRFAYYFPFSYEALFFALKVQHNLAQGAL